MDPSGPRAGTCPKDLCSIEQTPGAMQAPGVRGLATTAPYSCATRSAAFSILFRLFSRFVLGALGHDVVEPVNQHWVLIVQPSGDRQVIPLHPFAKREHSEFIADRRRDLFPANKEVYLFAETASPAFSSTACLRSSLRRSISLSISSMSMSACIQGFFVRMKNSRSWIAFGLNFSRIWSRA